MKARSEKHMKRRMLLLAIGCLMLAVGTSAFAVPLKQLLRVTHNQTFTGKCCLSFNETVSATEPTTPVPVQVTFTTDFLFPNTGVDAFIVGLSVNGGPCLAFGPNTLQDIGFTPNHFTERSFEWIVQPGGASGLHQGTNTFTLCGGAVNRSDGAITLGFHTLAVRISP